MAGGTFIRVGYQVFAQPRANRYSKHSANRAAEAWKSGRLSEL